MPTYIYSCPFHKEFEVQQSIKEEPLEKCPQCIQENKYEYYCKSCGTSWDILIDVNCTNKNCKSPDVVVRTPKPKKLISSTSFILNGSCWSKDNYSSGK